MGGFELGVWWFLYVRAWVRGYGWDRGYYTRGFTWIGDAELSLLRTDTSLLTQPARIDARRKTFICAALLLVRYDGGRCFRVGYLQLSDFRYAIAATLFPFLAHFFPFHTTAGCWVYKLLGLFIWQSSK